MRSEGEIKQKFKQLKYRLRKTKIEESVKKIPSNCINNQTYDFKNGSSIGICGLYAIPCDGRNEEGVEQAKECDDFKPYKPIDLIKEDFNSLVDSANQDIGALAFYYPELAALHWVLDPPDENYLGDAEPCHCEIKESVKEETVSEVKEEPSVGSDTEIPKVEEEAEEKKEDKSDETTSNSIRVTRPVVGLNLVETGIRPVEAGIRPNYRLQVLLGIIVVSGMMAAAVFIMLILMIGG